MNIRIIQNWIGLIAIVASLAAAPATRPIADATSPQLTARQQNLLVQLSDAEANIQAINKALARTGYKVGLAYDRIDSNLKGSELMDRKGGGPVRWDAFYGKTARDFGRLSTARNGNWGDARPQQFDFIYKANNDQIARAKDQIAALSQDQAGLLARRQKHESDQCRLWATLAWEQIKDREIELHPLSRFALKSPGPEAAVLRPIILFLCTADRVAVEGLDSVQQNPDGTFKTGARRLEAAYAALQRSLADALDATGLAPERKKEGEALKALCKNLAEECKVIAENHANALDRDKAKEDSSKLEFRGLLQGSLASFAAATGNLDEEIARTAKAWGVEADKATPTKDSVAAVPLVAGKATVAAQPPADLLQVGSVWAGRDNLTLTILERRGDDVKAKFVSHANIRIVSGVVKNGKFTWLAKDVQAVKGDVGGDNTGTINGDTLDFEFGTNKRISGTFTLRLVNHPPAVPR